jgi:hypothetical protein
MAVSYAPIPDLPTLASERGVSNHPKPPLVVRETSTVRDPSRHGALCAGLLGGTQANFQVIPYRMRQARVRQSHLTIPTADLPKPGLRTGAIFFQPV